MNLASAAQRSTFPLQFRDASEFERFVFRALAVSFVVGAFHSSCEGFSHGIPAWLFAGTAILVVAPRMSWLTRLTVIAVVGVGGVIGLTFFGGLASCVLFGAFFGGTVALVRNALPDEGPEHNGWHLLGCVVAGTLAVPIAEWSMHELWRAAAIPSGANTTRFVADWLLVVGNGLLLSTIAAPLHLHPRSDVLLEEGEKVVRTLRGRFRTIGDKVLDHARECRTLLANLPSDRALTELEATFDELLQSALHHLREWSGVEADLAEVSAAPSTSELARLRAEREATDDLVARQHFDAAIATIEEELERMTVLRTSRKRALARLEAQVALLSRVRGALIDVKSGHAEVRSVELGALARKLGALSRTQSLEGEVMRGVATGAELDQLAAASSAVELASGRVRGE